MSNLKKYIPFACAENIFEIDISFYIINNIKYIFCDLDNTLDPYYNKVPSQKSIDYVNKIINSGITFIVVSNNSKKRVLSYIKGFKNDKIIMISRAWKPLKFKLRKFIERNNIEKNSSVFIGDQLMTDIKVANKLNIKSILTKELVSKNQAISWFNKYLGRKKYNTLEEKGLLKSWREING